ANDPIKVNVRVLSATNKDLKDAIAKGTFREDLYHRLRVVEVRLPSLRERSQDIPLLIDHFIKLFSKRHERTIKRMSTEARRVLIAHDWPGNVRELSNVIERMVVVDFDGVLDLDDLPPELVEHPAATETDGESGGTPLSNLVGRPL